MIDKAEAIEELLGIIDNLCYMGAITEEEADHMDELIKAII